MVFWHFSFTPGIPPQVPRLWDDCGGHMQSELEGDVIELDIVLRPKSLSSLTAPSQVQETTAKPESGEGGLVALRGVGERHNPPCNNTSVNCFLKILYRMKIQTV